MDSVSTEATPQRGTALRRCITPRAVILGLLITAAVAAYTPYNDYYLDNTYFIGGQLPIGIYAILLFIVLCGNVAVRFIAPSAALTSHEMVTMLSLALTGASVSACGLHRFLVPALAMPWEHATHMEDVKTVLKDMPKELFAMTDVDSSEFQQYLYGGEDPIPWRLWIRPMIHWGVFTLSAYVAMMFLSLFMAHQWSRNEHLQFPLAVVPLTIVEDPKPGNLLNDLFSNKTMWLGFGLVLLVRLLEGLHRYYPQVPAFTTRWYLGRNLSENPWRYLPGYLKHCVIYASMVALAFIIPQNIGFSLWFFVVFLGVIIMLQRAYGPPLRAWDEGYEQMGGFIVMLAFQIIVMSEQIRRGLKSAWRWLKRPFRPAQDDAALSVVGCIVFSAISIAWLAWWGCGWWSFMAFGLLMMIHLMLARIVAEGGLIYVGARAYVAVLMVGLFGPMTIGINACVIIGLFTVIIGHDLRDSILPFGVTCYRMQEEKKGLNRRSLSFWMIVALLVAFFMGAWVQLYQYYHFGSRVMEWHATFGAFGRFVHPIQSNVRNRPDYDMHWFRFTAGFIFCSGLLFLRARLRWWPFHPLGFIAAHSYAMQCMWFSVLLGWLIKWLVQRYGGVRTVFKLRPFIIGCVLGDCFAAAMWMFIAAHTHLKGNVPISIRFMPG